VIKGKEDAIIAFLFNIRNNEAAKKAQDLAEIRENMKAFSKKDTAPNYLNLTAYAQFEDASGHPAIKPPWGTLNAINLNTGEYMWKIPVGTESSPGPVVTAGGLVFLGGTRDKKLFAFNKATGKLKWETTLPGNGSSTPCTYMVDGRQYIALSVAGGKDHPSGYIVAYSLPQ
jgi:quinoprotein glucose dehydrogenase